MGVFMKISKGFCYKVKMLFSVAMLLFVPFAYADPSNSEQLETSPVIVNLEPLQFEIVYPRNPHGNKSGTMPLIPVQNNSNVCSEDQAAPPLGEMGYNKGDITYIRPKVETIEFKQPGTKKLNLVNKWRGNVTILGVFFDMKKVSMVQTLRGVTVQGLEIDQIISSEGFSELQLQAKDNASASIYPEGNHFFVAYKVEVGGKEEIRYSEFKVKISYNRDIGFSERNLLFYGVNEECLRENCGWRPCESDGYGYHCGAVRCKQTGRFGFSYDCTNSCTKSCKQVKELTIKNKNAAQEIKIKQIGFLDLSKKVDPSVLDLTDAMAGVRIKKDDGIYLANNDCSSLKSGDTCKVMVAVDHEAQDGLVPLYVKYDVCDSNSGVCREIVARDVIESAVVVVDRKGTLGEDKKEAASISDKSFAADIANYIIKSVSGPSKSEIAPGASFVNGLSKELLKNVVVKELVNFIEPKSTFGKGAHVLDALFAGVVHSEVANRWLVNKTSTNVPNIFFTSAGKAGISELNRNVHNIRAPGFLSVFGCDAVANVVGYWVDLTVFPKGRYLPENWDGWLDAYHNTIIYTVSGMVKTGCMSTLGYVTPISGVVAILGETIFGAYKDYMDGGK
jgi:hypothetical protein